MVEFPLFRRTPNPVLNVHTLDNRRLENFLERHKAYYAYTGEIEIDRFLREILQKANEFVPSEAGSILLDDPFAELDAQNRYSIVWRINDAKRPETRARRVAKYLDMLRRGERIHG